MNEPTPKGIKPPVGPSPKEGLTTTVPGSSLKKAEFQALTNIIGARIAGSDTTSVDPETGALMSNTISKEDFEALSPAQQEAFLQGIQMKQDVALDALRAKENQIKK